MEFKIDFQPIGRTIMVTSGMTILEAAQKAGIGLSAVCGGQSACGTCLVRVGQLAPVSLPTSLEKNNINEEELRNGMRLACQTKLNAATRIEVPKESLTAMQRTQVEGEERKVILEPAVKAYDLSLAQGNELELKADWERLGDALIENGALNPIKGEMAVMRTVSEIIRNNDWHVQVAVRDDLVVSISPPTTPMLGVAVDLGTTKIAAYLVDLTTGSTLAMKGLMNPQITYGEDVMARIAFTMKHDNGLEILQTEVVKAINQVITEMCQQAISTNQSTDRIDFFPSQIVEMVVVGNTAMHHIFLGLPVKQLGMAPYVAAVSSALDVKAHDVGLKTAPGTLVHLLPNIAGFVGADHVAMLLATNCFSMKETVICLDIGTNTEITLLTDGRMVSCSTASGPAFEGAHIKDGMRAADGAVERVRVVDNQIEYQTIGDVKAIGICGSGILDAVAQLRLNNVINFRGAFEKEHELVRPKDNSLEVVIVPESETSHGRDITLNRKDVSEIQMAKGAIRAGIELLLKTTQKTSDDIDSFIIAGAFGTFISIESAVSIGMFPDLPRKRFKQVGNAAGIGAKLSLMSTVQRSLSANNASHIEYLELANHPDFTDEFAKAMSF